MEPTHVRARIMEEHDRLRGRLSQLEDAFSVFAVDPVLQLSELTELTRSLLDDFIGHTELEDRILAPALLDADAWGAVRASRLREAHVEQRHELRDLHAFLGDRGTAVQVRGRVLDWIVRVREDMQEEERTVLSQALLRDDVVAVGLEAG